MAPDSAKEVVAGTGSAMVIGGIEMKGVPHVGSREGLRQMQSLVKDGVLIFRAMRLTGKVLAVRGGLPECGKRGIVERIRGRLRQILLRVRATRVGMAMLSLPFHQSRVYLALQTSLAVALSLWITCHYQRMKRRKRKEPLRLRPIVVADAVAEPSQNPSVFLVAGSHGGAHGFRLLCYAMPSGVAQPKYRIKPAFFSTGPVHQGLRVRASREFLFSFRQLLTAGGNRQSCT